MVQDLDIVLSLMEVLVVLLGLQVFVVVSLVVLEGFPDYDPGGGIQEVCFNRMVLPRQLAVLRTILWIWTWR